MFYITPKIPAAIRQHFEASAAAQRRACSVLPSVPLHSTHLLQPGQEKTSLSTAHMECSKASAPNPSTSRSTGQCGWRSSTLLHSNHCCMNADVSCSCTSKGEPNIPLIIWVTTALTLSLGNFGHVKASSCTETEANCHAVY